jgi:hypothetical protein
VAASPKRAQSVWSGVQLLFVAKQSDEKEVCLSIYGSTALSLDLGLFSVSWSFTQSVGLLGQGISPSQGRYLHTQKSTQTCMPQVRFEPMIPVFEVEKTIHVLDHASTVIGRKASSEKCPTVALSSVLTIFDILVSVNAMYICIAIRHVESLKHSSAIRPSSTHSFDVSAKMSTEALR